MQFVASLRPNSAIHHLWRERSQLTGILDHVSFYWRGGEYISEVLNMEQVEGFRVRQDAAVRLEVFSPGSEASVGVLKGGEPNEASPDVELPSPGTDAAEQGVSKPPPSKPGRRRLLLE